MGKYIPTPWRVGGRVSVAFDEPDVPDVFIVDEASKGCLGVATAHGDDDAQAEATAAFIVTACNSHDKLIAALQAVEFKADKGANGGLKVPGKQTSIRDCKDLMREIRDGVHAVLVEVDE